MFEENNLLFAVCFSCLCFVDCVCVCVCVVFFCGLSHRLPSLFHANTPKKSLLALPALIDGQLRVPGI